jgi:NAD(P)-dependent dehydrogenase (short-subunit alcohol dehydrogenase family)
MRGEHLDAAAAVFRVQNVHAVEFETPAWCRTQDAGRQAVAVTCDIREESECRTLVERAVEEFGRIDILVNNAAYQMSQPDGIGAISTEQFDWVMRTNLYGMFWL